jgi:hypothetical protein
MATKMDCLSNGPGIVFGYTVPKPDCMRQNSHLAEWSTKYIRHRSDEG